MLSVIMHTPAVSALVGRKAQAVMEGEIRPKA